MTTKNLLTWCGMADILYYTLYQNEHKLKMFVCASLFNNKNGRKMYWNKSLVDRNVHSFRLFRWRIFGLENDSKFIFFLGHFLLLTSHIIKCIICVKLRSACVCVGNVLREIWSRIIQLRAFLFFDAHIDADGDNHNGFVFDSKIKIK